MKEVSDELTELSCVGRVHRLSSLGDNRLVFYAVPNRSNSGVRIKYQEQATKQRVFRHQLQRGASVRVQNADATTELRHFTTP